MAEVTKSIIDTTNVFIAFLILGLVGILFLIIFGNLSGNLGFQDVSNTTINETGYEINTTVETLTTAGEGSFVSATVIEVINATGGEVVGTGNYTVDSTAGTIVGSATRTHNYTDTNITYLTIFESQGEQDTDGVISNLTGGVGTFFTFSNVWFTLLAIVLLIIIVMAVIMVVKGKNNNFSS